jgi:hypothetical protein
MRTAIHIGYAKTATSALQEQYFSVASSIHFLPHEEGGAKTDAERDARAATFDMMCQDGVDFDEALAAQAFDAFLAEANSQTHKVHLISQERLASPTATNWRGDRAVIAERLKKFFPDGKIVVSLRSQHSMLHSQYINRTAKNTNYKPVDEWLHNYFASPNRGFATDFHYDRLVDLYREAFGNENVHVMLFEEFMQDREVFTDTLAQFLEIPESEFHSQNSVDKIAHPSKSARSLTYAKFRSRFFRGTSLSQFVPGPCAELVRRYIKGGDRAKVEFSPKWKNHITEYYSEGNGRLAASVGEERLRRYGYPLPGTPRF